MKKKIDPLTIAIYAIIVLVVLYASAALGAALQLSLKDNGEIDFNAFGEKFESVMVDTNVVFEHLQDTNSYGFMVNECDTVICYVWHVGGGARKFMEMAKKKHKTILNLADEG